MKRFRKVFTKGGCGVVGEVEVGSLVFLSIFRYFHLGCGLQGSCEDAEVKAILTSSDNAWFHVRILKNGSGNFSLQN